MSSHSSTSGWKKQSGFIWSMIGSAVGFANILSFSACAYKNGGGAFLIPYAIALCALGVPLLLLEGYIGKTFQLPLVSAYGQVAGRLGKALGWLSIIACATIGSFYIVLTGYSVAYAYFSGSQAIPDDTAAFFTQNFLQISSGIGDFGSLSLPVFAATFIVAVITWVVLARNIKDGVEKICSLFMPILALMMAVFAVVALCLPGGIHGLAYYLTPDFSRLFDAALWRDVFGQLLFSLSLGLGIVVGYSRHTNERIDIAKAMKWVAIGDFTVSFISGSAIFGCIAHIANITGVPFENIVTTDSSFEIGFIIFPKIMQHFGSLAPIMGVAFFFCVFIAGITGVFSIIESIAGNVEVEFGLTRKRAVSITMMLIIAFASIFCMGNASHIIDALAPMVIGSNMLLSSLALIAIFVFYCPSVGIYFKRSLLKTVVPAVLATIFVCSMYQEFAEPTVATTVRWSWFAMVCLVSLALAFKKAKAIEKTYASG